MNWTHEIATLPHFQRYSQNGEEGPLRFILEKIGILEKGFQSSVTDFGAGDGVELSNSWYLIDHCGWSGNLYDIDPRGAKDVAKLAVTKYNAGELARGCDVLLIDIDGNDFWVMEAALKQSTPAVILCEINTRFERSESFAAEYDEERQWDGTDYFGMSLEAAIRLGKRFGYSPVHLHCNYNLFLVRNDLLPEGPLPELKYGKFVGFTQSTKPFVEIHG